MTRTHYEGRIDVPPLAAGGALAPGYEILAHLHQSRNFDVYDVFSEERACRCIAKAPRQDLLGDEKVRRGLLREGGLLKKLTHPHIVCVYETLEEPQPTLILETLTGETLSHLIDTNYRRLPIRDIAHLGLHLCSAVHYLHGRGILHLDLKPSNIVSEHQMAKILDLSIARPPGRGHPGAGTRQYMAPEQVKGDLVGPETDVWGIGAVLYETATDVTPFNAEYETTSGSFVGPEDPEYETGSGDEYESEYETEDPGNYEQVSRRADPVRVHRRVPAAFGKIIARCLDPDPAGRPTVADLTSSLRALT
ncbi:MAG: serine/threonine protein kinase [Actinomycetota bacterium]|nr:serine/threonine protein kinase [Actinomycetota bacterium]